MSTTKNNMKQAKKLTIDEVIAREVAETDRRILEAAKEMSRPKQKPKSPK